MTSPRVSPQRSPRMSPQRTPLLVVLAYQVFVVFATVLPTRALAQDAVRVIESSRPAWTDAQRWRLSDRPRLTIGEAEGPEEYTFSRVLGVVVAPNGNVIVADGASATLRFYDAQGRFIRRAGRRGAGPASFRT